MSSFKERKSFLSNSLHISQIPLARIEPYVHAVAVRDAGRESFGHFDKPPYQEVGIAGKEKGIRSGFE